MRTCENKGLTKTFYCAIYEGRFKKRENAVTKEKWKWTEAAIKDCAKLWNDGWSFTEIAKRYGITRQMVAGAAYRNRKLFPKRPMQKRETKKEEIKKYKSKNNPATKSTKFADYKDRPLDDYELERLPGLSFMENEGCMYPLTNHNPHMFCGEERKEGSRYCCYHKKKTTRIAINWESDI